MKRVGRLFDQVTALENLHRAYREARRGKGLAASSLEFRPHDLTRLESIRQALVDGTFTFGNYRTFTILDPKRRLICAASFAERIVHHALVQVAGPWMERTWTDHSYACRTGKGTHKAVLQVFRTCRSRPWFVKLDVRAYYHSISHELLKVQLKRLFKDARLLSLWDNLIDSWAATPGRGIPIGNLTSQYLANHYLSSMDLAMQALPGCQGWVRYMDDMILLVASPEAAQAMVQAAQTFCRQGLDLELKAPIVGPVDQGIPFLGFLISPRGIRLLQANKRRYREKARAVTSSLVRGVLSEGEAGDRASALYSARTLARMVGFSRTVW